MQSDEERLDTKPPSAELPSERPVSFYATPRALTTVLVVLSCLTLIGVSGCLTMIIEPAFGLDVRARALMASVSMGITGSASYYLRRLYRAGFDDRLHLVNAGEKIPARISTVLYLLGRPLIAIPLALAASLTAVLTYTAVSPESAEPTANLVYLCAGVGFVTGFLGGRAISSVEKTGKI